MPHFDWTQYEPTDRAVLLFLFRDSAPGPADAGEPAAAVGSREVLLIRKKRGLGAGKINAPGGRVEPGESEEQAARRECREEVGLRAGAIRHVGELRFWFSDGYRLSCTVFTGESFEGSEEETEEALPAWHSIEKLPYHEMWEDDRHWLPLLLAQRSFSGRFEFDGDRMVWMDLRELRGAEG